MNISVPLFKFNGIRIPILICFILCVLRALPQEQPAEIKSPYDKKEEIIHQNKRYAIHNNYITLGPGFGASTYHSGLQKIIGADFQFHIRDQHFQLGGMISGPEFLGTTNLGGHLCYGYRWETRAWNLAAFLGPSWYYGVRTLKDTGGVSFPQIYQGPSVYLSLQAILKITYDIGAGVELNADVGRRQLFGCRFILFFSGAYRGVKRGYNPHVHAENPGK
jgi:hypothetical protein